MITMYEILDGMARVDTSKFLFMADTAGTRERDLKVFKKRE